jgi:hypothetical protein
MILSELIKALQKYERKGLENCTVMIAEGWAGTNVIHIIPDDSTPDETIEVSIKD